MSTYSAKSKVSPSQKTDMTVTTSGLNVTVTTATSAASPSDIFHGIVAPGLTLTLTGGSCTIPNDVNKYWLVPFDSSALPTRMNGGTTATPSCCCTEGGTCNIVISYDGEGNLAGWTCKPGTCTGDCCTETILTSTLIGSFFICTANQLTYNGVVYS